MAIKEAAIIEIKPVVVPAQFFAVGPLAAGLFVTFPGMFAFVISNLLTAIGGRDMFDGPVIVFGLAVYILAF